MLSTFRNLTKTKSGKIILALLGISIVASFGLADIGNQGFGLTGGTLARVGSKELTEREVSKAFERALTQARQQNPEADYASLAKDFDPLVAALLQEKAMLAFADTNGLIVSRRLVDAEIARLPNTRGLDGKFSDQAYAAFLQAQRMTDAELRQSLYSGLLQRLMLTPVVGSSKIPLGVAGPYASMLLEARQGEVALVPAALFRAGLNPTDADLEQFYAGNKARYIVPEQRVLRMASLGPEQVASMVATDTEIAAFYTANQAIYGGKDVRVLSQAVVADRSAADAIVARIRSGASFVAASAPAGLSAADVSVGPQSREQFNALAGAKVAAATFAAKPGSLVGPIQSDLGWHVIKIESATREAGKSLAAARPEIVAKLTPEKRIEALTDLVTRVEDAIADGSSFAEVAAANRLAIIETPPITATGVARSNPGYTFPANLAAVLKTGFDASPDDDATVETLPNNSGFVVLAVGRIIPAAPAPYAALRPQLTNDWIVKRASDRARAVASAIAARTAANVPLAKAIAEAGVPLPKLQPVALRRIDLAQIKGPVPAPIRMLFNLAAGKSRMVAASGGRGYFIVKVVRVVPGNALTQPGLIARAQAEFGEVAGQEYAQQFVGAIEDKMRVSRDATAIAAAKKRLTSGAN